MLNVIQYVNDDHIRNTVRVQECCLDVASDANVIAGCRGSLICLSVDQNNY